MVVYSFWYLNLRSMLPSSAASIPAVEQRGALDAASNAYRLESGMCSPQASLEMDRRNAAVLRYAAPAIHGPVRAIAECAPTTFQTA